MKETLDGEDCYEVVWVDDGSKDNTPNVLERICKENENVLVLPL
jgi:glycosyltransferase involved in cell wall biosynthesis